MSISTSLNNNKYYNDYDQTKDYYRNLYKVGVSVQSRELTQDHDFTQTQIERVADNIFSKGTIISGCNFTFYNPYPYAKIKDLDVEGEIVNPANFKNYSAISESTGLKATVLNYAEGYETTAPDYKTLYLRYLNSGYSGNAYTFSSGEIVKIYDPVYFGVNRVVVDVGGSGFSNTDPVIAIPAISVKVTSGSFANGDYIGNGLGANVQIVGIDSTTLANSSQVILSVAPKNSDLSAGIANTTLWNVANGQSIATSSNSCTGIVTSVIGSGYQGKIITDSVGTIKSLITLGQGQLYSTPPTIRVWSPNNVTGVSNLRLTPRNYLARVTITGGEGAVGNGYAFGVTEGQIYQKGYALRVVPQVIIVDKYSQIPSDVSVGFNTLETIVDSNVDTSLNDPSDTTNHKAPGADRLKLTPVLAIANTTEANANSEFFAICSWNNGNPYKQNQQTIYSTIGDEMAARTYEQSGDFVVDPFLVTTRSPTSNTEGSSFDIVIDPGLAYVGGYRVNTKQNFSVTVPKAASTETHDNYTVSLNYGSYVNVKNVAGVFKYNVGDTIQIVDTPKNYLSNTALIKAQSTTNPGLVIGTASIRSLVLDSGTPGDPNAIYKLYLFNVRMNSGKNFAQARCFYANSGEGFADAYTEINSSGNSVAVLKESDNSYMLFPTRLESLKNATNIIYTYKTMDTTLSVSNTGVMIKDISSSGNEVFPYSGSLTSGQMKDLYVVPKTTDLVFSANVTGTTAVSNSSNTGSGTSTTYTTDLRSGDYVYVWANATYFDVKQVRSVSNSTSIRFDSAPTFTGSANLTRVYPKSVPIPFGSRDGLSASVNANTNILSLSLGNNLAGSSPSNMALGVNIQRLGVTQGTKTPNRHGFVKIACSNNVGSTTGPWSLGVPDIFRLRNVYVGSNSSVSNTTTDQSTSFYIDSNHTTDYLDNGYLYLDPSSNMALNSSNWILVEFDYFSNSGAGVYDTVSYVGSNTATIQTNDSLPLSSLSGTVNTLEIPQIVASNGTEIDLMQAFDFRPSNAPTVTPGNNPGAAPINPTEAISFGTSEKKFPVPGSEMIASVEYYLGRTDSVFVSSNGVIATVQGVPNVDISKRVAPQSPSNSMRIMDLSVPAYPNIPATRSIDLIEILDTGVLNKKVPTFRNKRSSIKTLNNDSARPYDQPRVYVNQDIANIDRRLSDLEKTVSLSMLEANVASMNIPSSVDPTTNRFKFGYFVDDFSTQTFSDVSDPQYSASKEGNDIVPNKMLWDIPLLNAFGSLPYIEQTIITQENATSGSVLDPTSKPTCGLAYGNTVAYATTFRNWTDGVASYNPNANNTVDIYKVTLADLTHLQEYFGAGTGANLSSSFLTSDSQTGTATWSTTSAPRAATSYNVNTIDFSKLLIGANTAQDVIRAGRAPWDTVQRSGLYSNYLTQASMTGAGDLWTFFPSAEAPPVVLYFYCYDQPTLIEIFQGNNVVASTGTVLPLTETEKAMLGGSSGWFNDMTSTYLKDPVETGNNYVTFAGKIQFNYDWNGGSDFTIKTTSKQTNRMFTPWRWVFSYPINGSSVGCIPASVEWDLIAGHCTNGYEYAPAVFPVSNSTYSVSTSTSNYDINTLWATGNNAVIASGTATTTHESMKLIQDRIFWSH